MAGSKAKPFVKTLDAKSVTAELSSYPQMFLLLIQLRANGEPQPLEPGFAHVAPTQESTVTSFGLETAGGVHSAQL